LTAQRTCHERIIKKIMKNRIVCLAYIICALLSVHGQSWTSSNRLPANLNVPIRKCNSTDIPCYESFPYTTPGSTAQLPLERNEVFALAVYNNDSCSPVIGQKIMQNITCSEYFCSNRSVIAQVQKQALGNNSYSESVMIYNHHAVATFCYFCNHNDRSAFHTRRANGLCPYFWQHDPKACQEYPSDTKENLLLPRVAQYSIYYAYRKILNTNLNYNTNLNWDVNKLDGVLNVTEMRYNLSDYNFETTLGITPYMCYCPYLRFGSRCDITTRILIPFFFEFLPWINLVLGLFFTIMFVLICVIPKIVQIYKKKVKSSPETAIRNTLADLEFIAVVTAPIGMASNSISNPFMFLWYFLSSCNATGNVFIMLSYLFFGISVASLLVQWLHVFDSASSLQLKSKLSVKNRIILAIFALSMTFFVIAAALAYIIYFILLGIMPVPNVVLRTMVSVLCIIVVVFLSLFAGGFLIYGFRMYFMLRKNQSDLNFIKLKLTRFMIAVNISLIHYILWLILTAIEGFTPTSFLALAMFSNILPLGYCMFVTYFVIGVQLFNVKNFRAVYAKKQ
jgi:hypothetical protein